MKYYLFFFFLLSITSLSAAAPGYSLRLECALKIADDEHSIMDYLLQIEHAETKEQIKNGRNKIIALLNAGREPDYEELKFVFFGSGDAGGIALSLYYVQNIDLYNKKKQALNTINRAFLNRGFSFVDNLFENLYNFIK